MFNRILVLCTGNICRSPMAEALLAHRLGDGYTVASAGIGAVVGAPADEHAIALMDERGIDIRAHRARQIDLDLVRNHDLLLVMEDGQTAWICAQFPHARGRVFRLAHWRNADIADPYRRGRTAFEQALADIDRGIDDWCARIKPQSAPTSTRA